jgi:hypothetical protein
VPDPDGRYYDSYNTIDGSASGLVSLISLSLAGVGNYFVYHINTGGGGRGGGGAGEICVCGVCVCVGGGGVKVPFFWIGMQVWLNGCRLYEWMSLG